MDPQLIALVLQGLQFAWTVLLTVYVFNGRSNIQLRSQIEALEKSLTTMHSDLAAFRADLHSRPSATGLNESFSEVYERINAMDKATQDRINAMDKATQDNLRDLTGRLGEIKGTLSAVGPALAMLNQDALERKRHG